MNPRSEKLKKEIQKIIYNDLEVWKQHINDFGAKKIDKNIFKRYYVEFLQKIEDTITQFTLFFLKIESHKATNHILEDNLEKTALLETIAQFLSEPMKKAIKETVLEPEVIVHRKSPLSISSSPTKKEQPILFRASEIE